MRLAILALLSLAGRAFTAETSAPAAPLDEKLPRIPAVEPAQAEATIRSLHGFHMDLLAAEPLVASPVAMTYDEDGRAYVCEMVDYPYTDKAHHKPNQENPTDQPIGRVRLLVDANGDGKFDKSTIFAEGFSWPTGVACWRGGVFVAATPDIWYLKDTTGTGVANIKVKVFTGFKKLNVQAVMNNLVWGLDNRIYGAGGTNGGQIRPAHDPDAKPLLLARNDFRFDPVNAVKTFALISGGARFGNSFDDWGNRFLCNIRNPAQHVVLPGSYLARNPFLPVRSPLNDICESGDQVPVYRISPEEPWRALRAKRWAGERDLVMPRSELVASGVVTSSSGVTVYRGAAYPPEFRGNIFTAECAGNLLYRQTMTPDGVTFIAQRPDGKQEMAASTDIWFRPVNFVNAPDGTLHVCDMYREVIEHPWSIPDDIHAVLDLESGRDRGRIYRLSPPGFKPPKPPHLSKATTAELVADLANLNSWWRETAQRLLFERQDPAAIGPLRALVRDSAEPLARLHALWTLDGLHALTEDDLAHGLRDTMPGVRQHAVRLAESRLDQSPALLDQVLALASDPDIHVRFQTAFTLGETKDPRAGAALAAIAKRDAADPWVSAAVLSSASGLADQLLLALLRDDAFAASPAGRDFLQQVAFVVGARNHPDEMERVLAPLSTATPAARKITTTVFAGLGDGLKHTNHTLRVIAHSPLLDSLLEETQRLARDPTTPLDDRVQSVRLLGYDDFARVKTTLTELLDPRQPQEIQSAAVHAFAGSSDAAVSAILLKGWRTYTPAVRGEVIQIMLGLKNRILPLLAAVERGEIPVNQIPPARRQLLLRNRDPEILDRAQKLFGDGASSPRKDVIEKYKPALALKGDPASGRKVYETICAACHRLGDKGNDIGPSLASVHQWSPEQILVNVLDPNREVAPNYIQYVFELKDGQTVVGLISDETPTSITLRRADNVQQTLLRQNINTMTSLGISLMPEGLEQAVSIQQMADLIALITGSP